MKDFRRLSVWSVSHALTLDVYGASRKFPKEELFGLTSQIRRSSASVAYNIAEGCGLGSNAAFAHSLQTAFGSSSELDYQLLLAHDLGYLDKRAYTSFDARVREQQRMLHGLLTKVRRDVG